MPVEPESTNPNRTSLCISRNSGQAVWIGDARVQVEITAGKIRMRITADRSVTILREEIKPA